MAVPHSQLLSFSILILFEFNDGPNQGPLGVDRRLMWQDGSIIGMPNKVSCGCAESGRHDWAELGDQNDYIAFEGRTQSPAPFLKFILLFNYFELPLISLLNILDFTLKSFCIHLLL